jgi:ATP-binding cassette subfamily B protein
VFFLINSGMMKASANMAAQKIEKDSALVAKVIEYIQGIFEVRTFRLTGKRNRDLNLAIDENEHANSAMELKLIPYMTMQSFWLKALGTIIVLASVLLHIGGKMDLLTTIIMIISSYLIYAQLDNAGKYSALLRTVDVSVRQAQEILATPQMDISGEDIQPEHYDISAENIGFAYEKKKIIDGISLNIPEHTTTAIVGSSGGGKTTLTSLLSRFWDVDEGKVTLDGRDVRDYSMDALMQNYSFVFQRVYLFADTIANNIRFGQPDAPMEKVIAAAKKACCHDFITALPDGYDTVIGEGGASLSGGEKQRISIARCILKDAPIVILDEATASVDADNERAIQEAISELCRNKTLLVIAHRLKTIRDADRILVINDGEIVESGDHAQLMEMDGMYAHMVALQS